MEPFKVSLLDYGAGNVRSVRNAILAAGYEVETITSPSQILTAQAIVFPGVGSFGNAMSVLTEGGYAEPLRQYLEDFSRPYLGICLGMQCLFESSQESPGKGLGLFSGTVVEFDRAKAVVPHIGWNGWIAHKDSSVLPAKEGEVYFVHSYYVPFTDNEHVLTTTTYAGQTFVSAVQRGSVVATQFHPEKSGTIGLDVLRGFLHAAKTNGITSVPRTPTQSVTHLAKRLVVALDVRTNDMGDLVVTKGDQYDVREKGTVRNLGIPVKLAARYYEEGADEIAFLNITSFREGVLEDAPMLKVLEESSKSIFVPLTVGGGIRSYSSGGRTWSALEVASTYFRAGADKVSIGSDAVIASEQFLKNGKTGLSSIETISHVYGTQAVVVSIDPRRVYSTSIPSKHHAITLPTPGPNGETTCWYQCTTKGGRENRDICAVTVAKIVEELGAGEIMLNCIDMDGTGRGFDCALMRAVCEAVRIPVIASSGAGGVEHFEEVFRETGVQAALAAGIFHRKEVEIEDVKEHMHKKGIMARRLRK